MKETPFEYSSFCIRKTVAGIISLVQGMGVTIRYFVNPKTVITRQYPENRDTLQMFDRFRGPLYMPHDENGKNACTACGICEKSCPNGTISVFPTKDAGGRKVLGKYVYRISQCAFCGLCVEACPFGAIAMSKKFELSVYDRNALNWTLNQPQERSQGAC
jgi:NADH-quinone oxidoreductase subunit I